MGPTELGNLSQQVILLHQRQCCHNMHSHSWPTSSLQLCFTIKLQKSLLQFTPTPHLPPTSCSVTHHHAVLYQANFVNALGD